MTKGVNSILRFTPAEILNAARQLSYTEFEIIKTHTIAGYEALDNFTNIPKEIKTLAIKHHYRNGFGYPQRIIYENGIDPILVDILTVADSFSAIMEPRVYKKTLNEFQTLEIIKDPGNEKNAGLNFEVLEILTYLVDNDRINLKCFY
jgi:HD-GYP domain-containing protein (c-di-GMP phosphodiesterase class II)